MVVITHPLFCCMYRAFLYIRILFLIILNSFLSLLILEKISSNIFALPRPLWLRSTTVVVSGIIDVNTGNVINSICSYRCLNWWALSTTAVYYPSSAAFSFGLQEVRKMCFKCEATTRTLPKNWLMPVVSVQTGVKSGRRWLSTDVVVR